MKNITLLLTLVILIASCKKNSNNMKNANIGLNIDLMDTLVKPQDDFYNFVNGTWMKTAQIPDDRSRWGSFNELRKNTDLNTLGILKKAIKENKYKKGTDQRKAMDYFACILDTLNRKNQGIEPLKTHLNRITQIQTKKEILDFLSYSEPFLNSSFFGISIRANMKNSDKNALYFYPSSGGLPEREFYLSDDADSKKIRQQYKVFIKKMLSYIINDSSKIQKATENIIRIETQLAKAKLSKEEARNPDNTYNPMKLIDLEKTAPDFRVNSFLSQLNIKTDSLIVSQPDYMKKANELFIKSSISQLKDYLTWNVLRGAANKLSPEISNTQWEFYGKALNGEKERKALNERALTSINWSIGEALGKLYVDQLFPPEAKKKAEEMVSYLQKAYDKRITDLTWMSAETKVKAKEKVAGLQIKIGYPDKWKDYSNLEIKSIENGGNYFENSIRISQWNFNKNVAKLDKPVDKTEWGMAPQIVNAYYNPSYNEIVFPAAILQPPFYDYRADEAVNYGAMGAVIGHEISHGFDDRGAKFDKDGNFKNWWTEDDFTAFNKLGKQLIDQYSTLEVLPDIYVNGEFTLGENIGDLGGTNAALTALDLYFKDHNKPENIQGYTPKQRFFISWATVWRTMSREAALKNQIKTDPHAPGLVRATQPIKNIDAFYKAFDIKEGDSMYIKPKNRVKIW
jgi:putative endopeptidase